MLAPGSRIAREIVDEDAGERSRTGEGHFLNRQIRLTCGRWHRKLTTTSDYNAIRTQPTWTDRGEADAQASDGFRREERTLQARGQWFDPLAGGRSSDAPPLSRRRAADPR